MITLLAWADMRHDLEGGPGRAARWLLRQDPALVGSAALVFIAILGFVDYVTGPDLAFSPLYLVPLCAAAWRLRTRYGLALAVVCTAVWETADVLAGEVYSSPIVPLWNTAARLFTYVLVVLLLTRLRQTLRSSGRLAVTCPLTAVGNRRGFDKAMREAVDDANEVGRPLSVVYLDLDDFKGINDQLGHSGGDQVLCAVATALVERTRSTDYVARLGGDEFAIILPETSSCEARTVMEAMMPRLTEALDGLPLTPTFSAGVATFLVLPSHVDEVLEVADDLMYAAKRAGKNAYRHVTIGAGELAAFADAPTPRRRGELTTTAP